jgi:hypothetical protein
MSALLSKGWRCFNDYASGIWKTGTGLPTCAALGCTLRRAGLLALLAGSLLRKILQFLLINLYLSRLFHLSPQVGNEQIEHL